ncbi:MAG: transposase [Candidatus Korobacteraceae bacterium]
MDGSAAVKIQQPKRQRRSIAEKRRIVELVMQPGASIARVAREHGVNANMVHYWRKLYREGRLGENKANSVHLLPVSVSESSVAAVVEPVTRLASPTASIASSCSGSIYIEFPKIHLRIESGADAALLRLVLESLPR